MKTKKTILMLLLAAVSFQASAQVSDEVYHERLYYLCKVWGHAKYYHTRIAAGLVNWDNELLVAAAGAKIAPDAAAYNNILLTMLNNAGPMGTSTATLTVVPDSLNNNNDLAWMQSSFLSEPVKAILFDIKDKFRPQSNVYVGEAFAGGNPVFTSDNMYYSDEDYPSEEKRILAMFRYWNQVLYFFPYYKIMDQDWDATLMEFIPAIVQAENAVSFNLAFKEFTTHINDTHAAYISPVYNNWKGNSYPPFLVRYIEDEMVITKVLPGITEISAGDVIKEIDGEGIDNLRESLMKYISGSNEVSLERYLNDLIMWGDPGNFQLTVENGTGTYTTTSLNRNAENYSNLQINTSPVWYETIMDDNCTFGIVDMARLETTQVAQMFADFSNTDAIIFDVRNYPKGTLWTIVNYLYPAPIHIANFTSPDITYPGTLSWKYTTIGTGTTNPYNGKVIILFDERTLSMAEYTCMGLERFPGAIKIGSMTAGADGNVSQTYLTGNINTNFTGLGTFYPDYTPTQRVGIIPDFEVHPTIEGIRTGNDEVLEFALNCSLLESDYCTSSGCNSSTEWIQKVSLGAYINNSGSDIGYGDYTFAPIDVEDGKTYSLSITPGFAGKSRTEYCRVWIDYNMDGDFSDSGEQVFAANRMKSTVSGNITIPSGISGERRMRISMKYNVIPTPCENFAYGEVEDYMLNIIAPAPPPPTAGFSGSPTAIYVGGSVQFTDLSTNEPTSWTWAFEGGEPGTSNNQNPSVAYNAAGTYDVTLSVSNASGSDILTIADYITVTEPTSCPDIYEPNETLAAATPIPVNTDISALIGVSGDNDWYSFSTTGTAKNVQITLTNLPANYDVVLYNSSGSQLGISQKTGTSDEIINYNTKKTGAYYIKVYGAGGTFNPVNCYTLQAAISASSYKSSEVFVDDESVELTVYPNPSNTAFNFSLKTSSKELVSIQLYDLSGRLLEEQNSLSPDDIFTAGKNLSVGMFVVIVKQGEFRKMVKIVKIN